MMSDCSFDVVMVPAPGAPRIYTYSFVIRSVVCFLDYLSALRVKACTKLCRLVDVEENVARLARRNVKQGTLAEA